MSDNIVPAMSKTECTNFVTAGKHYDAFQMFSALEDISNRLSLLRLIVDDLLNASDVHAVSYNKALQSGLSPCLLSEFGRDVYLRSYILLDNVCQIEATLKRFDIHCE